MSTWICSDQFLLSFMLLNIRVSWHFCSYTDRQFFLLLWGIPISSTGEWLICPKRFIQCLITQQFILLSLAELWQISFPSQKRCVLSKQRKKTSKLFLWTNVIHVWQYLCLRVSKQPLCHLQKIGCFCERLISSKEKNIFFLCSKYSLWKLFHIFILYAKFWNMFGDLWVSQTYHKNV